MNTEIESKLKVVSHEPIRALLRIASAAYVGRVVEINRILDREDGELLRTGRGLRIRSVTTIDGKPASPTLTYKGEKIPGKFKQREELETTLVDTESVLAIFAALGYLPRVTFEKRRETWLLGPCNVELDEVPRLGRFVEVEGPSEAAIEGILTYLELTGEASITESYVSLLMQGRVPATGEICEFLF